MVNSPGGLSSNHPETDFLLVSLEEDRDWRDGEVGDFQNIGSFLRRMWMLGPGCMAGANNNSYKLLFMKERKLGTRR